MPKVQDLSAPTATSNAMALTLPGRLATLPGVGNPAALPDADGFESCAYVNFASDRANQWAAQQAAGCVDGTPFIYADGVFTKLDPFVYFLFDAGEFATTMNNVGAVTSCSTDMGKVGRGKDDPKAHYVCMVLVDTGTNFLPAKMEARSTKSDAARPLINAVKMAASPDWPKQSEAHAITAGFPYPFGRVCGRVTISPYMNKTSGQKSTIARANPVPATLEQMKRLGEFLSNPLVANVLDPVTEAYKLRVETLKKIAGVS